MVSTRQAAKDGTRRSILEAAAGQFARHGYEATTFSGIASAMGKPKSAVGYHHFRSKFDLASAIVSEQRLTWDELADNAISARGPGLAGLFQFFDDVRANFAEDPIAPGAARLILEDAELALDLPRSNHSWRRFTTEQIAEAVSRGDLPTSTDPRELAAAILSAGIGVFRSVRSGVEVASPDRVLRTLWRDTLVGAGLSPQQADSVLP
jgi:AcrR family transcriptional regulator